MKKIYFLLLASMFLGSAKGYTRPDISNCPLLFPSTIESAIYTNRPVSDDDYTNTYWQIINHPPLGRSHPLSAEVIQPPDTKCKQGTCCTYDVYFEGMKEPYKIRFYLTEEFSYLKRNWRFFKHVLKTDHNV